MDHVPPDTRSQIMRSVKGKHTKPEMAVRRLVHGMGFRYRTHDSQVVGRPDISNRKRKIAIFVHGCFWHGHQGCRYGRLPKSRVQFWCDKQDRNRERDQRNYLRLIIQGWAVLEVWQCDLRNTPRLIETLASFLRNTHRCHG